MRGRCSQCGKPAPGYDRLAERDWLFVPLWGIPTHFRYAPRRVECAEHGVVVGFDDGVVRVEVSDAVWMRQMMSLRGVLEREMAKIAGVTVSGIHFELKKN